jgi:hypothetical protein
LARRIFRILLKCLIIGTLLVMVAGILLLKWVERSPEQLKVGFESYLTQQTGYPADIGRLDHVTFFPNMAIDMADVRFWALDNPDRTMIAIERAQLRMPLWSVLLGSPRFSLLSLERMTVDQGVTNIAPMSLDSLVLDDALPAMQARGEIGGVRVSLDLPLEKAGGAFKPIHPPIRLSGTIEGARTNGDFFIDMNDDDYGATASFSAYAAQDMRGAQMMVSRWLMGRLEEGDTLPIQLHIDTLEGTPGPFIVPALRYENGALQPLECFYNNQDQAQADPHPCAVYFEEPDTDQTP